MTFLPHSSWEQRGGIYSKWALFSTLPLIFSFMWSRKIGPQRPMNIFHRWVCGKKDTYYTGFGLRYCIQIEGKQNKQTNRKSCGLDLKKVSETTMWCLMSNHVSWEGVWNILERWEDLESRDNRCLTLLERCWDAVSKGLWIPLGTKLPII